MGCDGTGSGDSEIATKPKETQERHLKGVGDGERRRYEHFEESAEEVAARTAMRHHEHEHRRKGEAIRRNPPCKSRTS